MGTVQINFPKETRTYVDRYWRVPLVINENNIILRINQHRSENVKKKSRTRDVSKKPEDLKAIKFTE